MTSTPQFAKRFTRRVRAVAATLMMSTILVAEMAIASIGADTPGRLMNDLARDFGLQTHQAAGIVGNFAVETGNFKHQQEINPLRGGKGGWGIAQWTGSRRREFFDYANGRGMDPSSYEAQYGFLSHELNGGYKNVLRKMQNAATTEEAAWIFMKEFERPGIPHWEKRLQYAMNAANGDFGDAGGGFTGGPGGGMGGATQPIESLKLRLFPWGAA